VSAAADPRPTRVHHFVLAALLLITTINYLQRNAIGLVKQDLKDDIGLTDGEIGAVNSAFFLGYTLMQVPSGWLAQRLGARAALSLYAAAWSLFAGLCALAHGLFGLYAARVALGAAQAGIVPCCTLILAVWYPRTLRGVATALLNSFMIAGSVIAAALTPLLLEAVNWRLLFGLYMLPGLAWALWFAWWFRNRPADHPGVNAAERDVIAETPPKETPPAPAGPPPAAAATPWLAILLNASLWLICVQQACRAGANRFYEYELPNYLHDARGQSKRRAGFLTSLPQAAGLVGGLVGGALSDWILRRTGSRILARNGVALLSLAGGALCFFAAFPVPDTLVSVLMFSLGAFLVTFAAPCSFALTMDVAGRHVAIVVALMNTAGNLGAYLFTQGLPLLEARAGWDAALAVFAGLHVVAAVCWLFIRSEQTIGETAGAASVRDEPPRAQGPGPVHKAP